MAFNRTPAVLNVPDDCVVTLAIAMSGAQEARAELMRCLEQCRKQSCHGLLGSIGVRAGT